MTVSTMANCESIPNRNNMVKNSTDHNNDIGIRERPSGMTINAKPKKEREKERKLKVI